MNPQDTPSDEWSREHTPEMHVSDEVLEAANVLDALKSQQTSQMQNVGDHSILDKVVSHPIITNSINYVLEKTISSVNVNALNKRPIQDETEQDNEKIRKRLKITNTNTNHTTKKLLDLRQKATLQSAVANTQKSLQNIKDLSALNINIESRKKLTMLIKFLKLGNNQLSERIDKLIETVDKHRPKIDTKINKIQTNDINAITSDIVSTVKKIVNVVSKVPAQSFSEPARIKIREALLRLPTNWSSNELHFLTGDDLTSISSSSSSENEDDSDNEDEEDGSNSDYEDTKESFEPIQTIRVTNKRLFQKVGRPSITRRLLNSLLEYRQRKQGKSQLKMRKWFKEKIRNQMVNDSSNGKVLILAQESLDMINKIIRTCNESLDKAENWNIGKQLIHQEELSNKLKDIEKKPIHSSNKSTTELITVKKSNTNNSNNNNNNNNQ